MIRHVFAAFFLFFLAIFNSGNGNAAASYSPQATWIVNPDKIASLAQDEQKWLAVTLSRVGINVIYDKTVKAAALESIPHHPQVLTPLIRGKHVDICLINPGIEDLHIGIVTKDMLVLQGEALEEFEEMLRHVVHCFQILGYGDYLGFCNFGKKYFSISGEHIKGQCWEMIPLGKNYVADKNGPYAVTSKIWRNNYVLFNRTPDFKQINPVLVNQFAQLLQSRLVCGSPCSLAFYKSSLPWKIEITDAEYAKNVSIHRVFSVLQKLGAVSIPNVLDDTEFLAMIEEEEGELPPKFNPHRVQESHTCAFCKEDVLKKQGMVRNSDVTVLYNRSAYTKNAHFLIIPTCHEESFHSVKPRQFEQMIAWAQKVSFSLGNTNDVIWFCQNGPRAGQTVPHTHLHVLRRPDPLGFSIRVFDELSVNKWKQAGEEECQFNRKWLTKELSALDPKREKKAS